MSAYAISCPNCGGSLDVFGGGRQIATLTCKYCGSVLDVEHEYKVLAEFKKVPLPSTPFRLGMQGKIKDIEFTIIGMVAYGSVKWVSVGEDTWVDFMLHSPTHGYAWLSYENGHTLFSRRTRKLPSVKLASLDPKEKFTFDGRTYRLYEHYRAFVTYVQGELTWIARKNDVTAFSDAIAPPYGLSQERTYNESEYFISEYLDAKTVCESFGVKAETPNSFHALKPFSAPKRKALSQVSALFAILTLLVITVLSLFYSGHTVSQAFFQTKTERIAFHIDDPSHLVELNLRSNVDNDWIYYDMSVKNREGEEVYSLGKEISYYHGYEGGESWSEGSKRATAYFKVAHSGDYFVQFNAPEYRRAVQTNVAIKENVIRTFYFNILFFIALFGSLTYPVAYGLYTVRLWKHLEGDDDE